MHSNRQTAVAVGVLFLTATVTYYIADMLIVGVLGNPDTLADLSAHSNNLRIAALFALMEAGAAIGIAVLMYPLLKSHNEQLALGYVGFRVLESAAILFFLAVPLFLAVFVDGGRLGETSDVAVSQELGSLLKTQYEVAWRMVWLLAALAGIIFAYLLFRTRLVPRWLAVLGCVGYPLMLVGTLLYMFGKIDLFQTSAGTIVAAPVGLFELILPIWLFTKGFNDYPDQAGA